MKIFSRKYLQHCYCKITFQENIFNFPSDIIMCLSPVFHLEQFMDFKGDWRVVLIVIVVLSFFRLHPQEHQQRTYLTHPDCESTVQCSRETILAQLNAGFTYARR